MIKNKRDFDLYDTIKSIESNLYKREFNSINSPMEPFAIVRTRESEYENIVKVERFETAQENLVKDVGDGIIQRFIRSKGRNRDLDK